MSLRRARPLDELFQDKGFAFHVGQLIGAASMASHLLQQDNTDPKAVGQRLGEAVGWFFTERNGPDQP